jgi:Tetratricopeptide repeat
MGGAGRERASFEVREAVLGFDDAQTLASMDNLALVLQDQGKYDEAEPMNRQALAGYEKVLGMVHPDTLTSAHGLESFLVQGRTQEA